MEGLDAAVGSGERGAAFRSTGAYGAVPGDIRGRALGSRIVRSMSGSLAIMRGAIGGGAPNVTAGGIGGPSIGGCPVRPVRAGNSSRGPPRGNVSTASSELGGDCNSCGFALGARRLTKKG